MKKYEIVKIQECPVLQDQAVNWFYDKWKILAEVYKESMEQSIKCENSIPQWYVVMNGEEIIGGLGVIENDFHNRKDLTPNICAVYVEEEYRCNGIAGEMLSTVCKEMSKKNIKNLYLITNHTTFYERYGWEFLCMVQPEDETEQTRMYVHREK